jgi:ABC-type multidrug transport system fused ATPase/permease subunit
VGSATWVGVGYMIFLMPINTVVFSIVANQRRAVLKYSDLRVKMMNEILSGIRIIKFYAWERPFGAEVGRLREKEIEALTKLAYTSAVGFSLILLSAPIIQPILVFLTYVAIQDKPMDAATAFTTVALFNIMRFPFAFLPMGLLQYIQSKISLRRLERYLDLPELAEYVEETPPPNTIDPSEREYGSLTVRDGTFSWIDPDAKPIRDIQEAKKKRNKSERSSRKSKKDAKEQDNGKSTGSEIGVSSHSYASSVNTEASSVKVPTITLQDLNFHIPAGSLVAVVGSVGSGKSSLLSAMLGEMEPINDSRVYIPRPTDAPPGFISYCAQTPWVVNDTLRGNVLFGREYDEERYEQVVEASALVDDLAVLPAGDFTEIGERGINLSGGQKARVSLARALYSSETKLILLDDPLSAVDAHVGEHIFSQAINGDISKGITRILVTHHVHLLSRCDSVIVLEHGRIKHHGSYFDLVAQGVDFAGAIDVSKVLASSQKENEDGDNSTTAETDITVTTEKDGENAKKVTKEEKENAAKVSESTKAKLKQSGKKLLTDEEREEGSVSGSAYWHYASAGGFWIAAWMCIIQGLGRGCEIMGGFWLAIWADRSLAAARSGDPLSKSETNFYVGIYGVFGLVGVLGLTFRSILVAWHRLGASVKLHNDLTARILRVPSKLQILYV